MKGLLQRIASAILDIIFPKICFGCGSLGSYFCAACLIATPLQTVQRCIMCQKPSLEGLTHPQCHTKYSPDRLTSLYNYRTSPIKSLLIAGKYQFVQEIFTLFSQTFATHHKINVPFVVCSIPLSKKRYRWRGFNQAETVALSLAAQANVAYQPILHRLRHTNVQKDLSKQERILNLHNAFKIRSKIAPPGHVVIVDDVSTTGTTFLEATKALKRGGVAYVWCIAIAQD